MDCDDFSIFQVSYLTKPYGVCVKDQKLKRYPVYNQLNCKMECRTENFEKECGCREFYMPNGTGEKTAEKSFRFIVTCILENDIIALHHNSYVKITWQSFIDELFKKTFSIVCLLIIQILRYRKIYFKFIIIS